MSKKYYDGPVQDTERTLEELEKAIEKSLSVTAVWRVSMDQVTGKAKLKK